jgi:hypothetical protein
LEENYEDGTLINWFNDYNNSIIKNGNY